MSEACSAGSDGGVTRRSAVAFRAAEWLSLAAAPTFAIMALLTGVLGGGPAEMLCSAAHPSPLSGMVVMYLLMSAFHSSPWLTLISGRRRAGRRSRSGGCGDGEQTTEGGGALLIDAADGQPAGRRMSRSAPSFPLKTIRRS